MGICPWSPIFNNSLLQDDKRVENNLINDLHKKESANGNARWNVNFFHCDLIGLDSKTAKKLRFKVHFV